MSTEICRTSHARRCFKPLPWQARSPPYQDNDYGPGESFDFVSPRCHISKTCPLFPRKDIAHDSACQAPTWHAHSPCSCTFFDARPESTPRRCCDLGAQLMIFYSTAQSMRLSTTGGTGSFLRKQPLRSLHSTCDHLMAFPSRRFQHAHALVLCCYRHRRDAVAPPECSRQCCAPQTQYTQASMTLLPT